MTYIQFFPTGFLPIPMDTKIFKKIKAAVFEGSKVKVGEGMHAWLSYTS